jgi:hypothetical protein
VGAQGIKEGLIVSRFLVEFRHAPEVSAEAHLHKNQVAQLSFEAREFRVGYIGGAYAEGEVGCHSMSLVA